MGLKDAFQEVAASKPLFLTIYTTVIVGIVVSTFYVFSAISSPDSTAWLSSPPSSPSPVMPPLWCRVDRLWFPHPGVLEGSLTRQPFLCPLDHVFEIQMMLKELPEDEFGPGISIREYSFLDNPSMPKHVKESRLNVQMCQVGSKDRQVSNGTNCKGLLRLPKHSNEETLKAVFFNFKDIRVIQFSLMQDAFSGFSDKAREDGFVNRMKRYMGIWCCMTNHVPGHIYYDTYWDEKPNWKPAPPQTAEDDHPPW